jgi:hypothetical protein
VSDKALAGAIGAFPSQRVTFLPFGDTVVLQQFADTVVIAECRQSVGVAMTENLLSRVSASTDSDPFDKLQVIGRPDLRTATRVIGPDVDRSDLQSE